MKLFVTVCAALLASGTQAATLTSVQGAPAIGDQGAGITNHLIFLMQGDGESLQYVRFNSGNIASEFDTFAGSYVSEAQIWVMIILGFGMVGWAARRRTPPNRHDLSRV